MRTLQSNFRSRVHSLELAVSMVALAACAGVTRQPIRYTSLDESTITVVNGHPRNIRVSLITAGGKAYYLGTVDAVSTRKIGIPPAFRDATVQLLLKVQSRSFRSIPEGAVTISSTQRPIPPASTPSKRSTCSPVGPSSCGLDRP